MWLRREDVNSKLHALCSRTHGKKMCPLLLPLRPCVRFTRLFCRRCIELTSCACFHFVPCVQFGQLLLWLPRVFSSRVSCCYRVFSSRVCSRRYRVFDSPACSCPYRCVQFACLSCRYHVFSSRVCACRYRGFSSPVCSCPYRVFSSPVLIVVTVCCDVM